MPHRFRFAVPSTLVPVLAFALGCGAPGTTAPAESASPAATASASAPSATPGAGNATRSTDADSAGHNRADIEFARDLAPHHEQAVVAAELAQERASDPAVRDLARRIAEAQEPETNQLLAMLRMWGEDVTPGGDSGEHEHSHLMTEETFQQLHDAADAEFDTLWLRTMIEHHRGAVELAEAQLDNGSDTLATMYAEKIIDRQTRQITEMRELLGE
ncbi:DUF305 domain-containing protein [Saccharomonospora iraqiensis]|uniref:DUF305 domain-containing protein n=1 Tax=Saccharomonospora iraqiensis TaxID=52698 RepID=UPI00022E7BED|nr:DUF305 domain-containing protein [Saccharomonospora iraqiensis]